MTTRWVKKRDGRIEPFDETRIARAVRRAARRTGSAAEVAQLAREIARSVTLSLVEHGRAPETALIARQVDEALARTGHAEIARLVRDWRDWRQKRQGEVRVRDHEPGDDRVEVLSLRAARPWTKQRIVEALQAEAELEREAAEEVARAVEERVFAAGLNRISSNLLRELIDAELFERGYSAQLGRLEVLGVSKPELERLAFRQQGRVPLSLEERVSRVALERFALDELLEGPGAVAHRRGDIYLSGLGRPYRMAAGGVCARSLVEGPGDDPPPDPYLAVRRLLRPVREGLTRYDLMFGLVGLETAFAPYVDDEATLRGAIELFLEALVGPSPDDLPPSPEVVLAVNAPPADPAASRVLDLLIAALSARGWHGVGVRLALRIPEPSPAGERLARAMMLGASGGAGLDLILGPGPGLCSRGLCAGRNASQVALLNVAGLALAAGRGRRERLTRLSEQAVEAALDAFHKRRRRVFARALRDPLALFGEEAAPEGGNADAPASLPPMHEVLGLVGLAAAMRYLTGEGPEENPRVAELAGEIQQEIAECVARVGARRGLETRIEEVPPGDAVIRLAAQDVDRFPDARELLAEAAGWDAGVGVRSDGPALLADLRVRLRLARAAGRPLVLTRPVLAEAPQPGAIWEAFARA